MLGVRTRWSGDVSLEGQVIKTSSMGWLTRLEGLGGRGGLAKLVLCCSLPEIDSWYQRAEVSPLNKMKSMCLADGDDRKIYQGPGKINIWTGDTARAASRGGSLCIYSVCFLPATRLQRAAGPAIQLASERRDTHTDRSGHPGKKETERRANTLLKQGGHRRLELRPGPATHLFQP